jgi:hypothetical protein
MINIVRRGSNVGDWVEELRPATNEAIRGAPLDGGFTNACTPWPTVREPRGADFSHPVKAELRSSSR